MSKMSVQAPSSESALGQQEPEMMSLTRTRMPGEWICFVLFLGEMHGQIFSVR